MNKSLIYLFVITCALLGRAVCAETKVEFQRTLQLAPSDHIVLDVEVPKGDVTIAYSHAGEISIAATARTAEDKELPQDFFARGLTVEREGSHVRVRFDSKTSNPTAALRISYTIGVPNWIEVNSHVGSGKQMISGVMGPVRAVSESGDLKILYVTDVLEAKTGNGNITVIRVGSAAKVETGIGNINLKDIGPGSVAVVKKGTGRIEVGGISGSFVGSTDAGELDVNGGVFDDWQLSSASGNIRIATGPESKFEIDAATQSGQLLVENDDIEMPGGGDVRTCHQKVNGGGKLIRAHSASGNIVIQ